MEKRIVIVVADTNDADYVTQITELKDWKLEVLPTLLKVAEVIKNFEKKYRQHHNHHNWEDADRHNAINVLDTYKGDITQEDKDIVEEAFFPPGDEQYGIHTIESIKILTISNEEELV